MPIASDGKGNFLTLGQDGQWVPATRARNPETGAELLLDGTEWRPVPAPAAPAAPERGLGEQAARGFGLGVRDVIEGAAAIPGLAVDAITYPGRLAARALGYEATAPTEMLSQGLTAAGLPQAETSTEQGLSAGIRGAAAAIPTMGLGLSPGLMRAAPGVANALAGGMTGQAVGGFTGGVAADAARQNELGPMAQMGAGLVGGLAGAGGVATLAAGGRGLAGAVQPFTETGRRDIVRNTLLQGSSQPETLAARLAAGSDPERRLPGSPATTAQQARDPGLLPIELGMRSDVVGTPGNASPAARFREVDAERNQVRTNALMEMGDGSTPDARGAAVRGSPAAGGSPGTGLAGAEQTRRASVGRAYEAIDPDGTSRLPLQPVRAAATEAEARYFGEMSGAMPAPLRSALDDIAAAGEAAPWRTMQNLRQRLGEIAGNPDPTQARAAAAAKQIRQSIDDAAERAGAPIERPSRPLTEEDISAGYADEGAAQNPDIAGRLGMSRDDLATGSAGDVPGPEGLSLVQFLRRMGGLQNQSGELAAMMGGNGRAMPGLWNGRGMTLERAAEAAFERGYIGETARSESTGAGKYSHRELLDALDAELRGSARRYPRGDVRTRGSGRQASLADDLDQEIQARGGSYSPSDPQATLRSLREPSEAPLGGGMEPPDRFAAIDSPFTPEQAERWRAASAARREMGQDFARDTAGAKASGDILRRDPFGNPMLPDAKVPSAALRSAADVRQVLRAAGDGADGVREQLRGQFIEELTGRARTAAVNHRGDRVLAPAGFRKFLDDKSGVMAEIFEPGHAAQLRRIADDFAETSMANSVSAARGSPTAQNLSVGNFLARASNGLIDANNPLAQTVAGLGPVMRWVYAAPEAAVREMFAEAMVNPTFARDLLSHASPESMRRALGYVEQTMGERLRIAAGGATARQGVRSTGEVNRPQSPARTNLLMGPGGAPAARNSLLAP